MQTELTRLLGIQAPIIQGGMAWVAEHTLAAAVSNAGGLGIIGAANAPAEWVREQIRLTKQLTDKPFGVNVMLMSPYAPEIAQVVAEEGVSVVTTGAGNPESYMALWKSKGIKVIPVVASVALAKRMERAGADAVVAEGCESGGHIGESTTMTLVPQVVDALNIPVIADIDTKVTGRSTGHPVRALRNEMTKQYLDLEKKGATLEELEYLTLGGLRKAVVEGDVKNGSVMSGQIAGMIKEELTCKEVIENIVAEAEKLLEKGACYE